MKLSEISQKLKLEFFGKDLEIEKLSSLQNSFANSLTYCVDENHSNELKHTKAGAAIITKNLVSFLPLGISYIICDNPYLAFAMISKEFSNPLFYAKKLNLINESAFIMPNVYIGNGVNIAQNVTIMSGAYIGDNVNIGENSIIYPNVVIYNNSKIGKNCTIHANSVIGSDGFGYAHTKTGEHIKIYHNGWVELEDFVEIGACTTIDRGVFEPTIIKRGTKIDNLVQVGHNCEIGENSILVSQTGLAGSSILGRNVVMGGQSGTKGHIKIGDFSQIAARGGVSKDLDSKKTYAGYPIMELKEWFKLNAKIIRFFKNN